MKNPALFLLLFLSLPLLLCGCGRRPEEIGAIHVVQYDIGTAYYECKIDLVNQTFHEFTVDDTWTERDPSAPDEGYGTVRDLDGDRVEAFIRQARKNRFCRWEETYENPEVLDGYQCRIEITYRDGAQQSVFLSNAFPDTFNAMSEAFTELTGADIF